MKIEPSSILEQLDKAAETYVFPMLDNGYVYPGGVRLSIYRDDGRWLMVIEAIGAHWPRLSAPETFSNCVHLYGNALHRKFGTANEDFVYPVESLQEDPLVDEEGWNIRKDCSSLSIRGQRVTFNASSEAFSEKGISLLEPPAIDPPALMRLLLPEYRALFLLTEQELAGRNAHGLPLFIELDEWFHPDVCSGELPSQNVTFQMLADATATGDRSLYRPTRSPNTHWKNWPDGGSL